MRDYEYEKSVIMHWGVPGMKRPRGLKYNTKGNKFDSTSLWQKRKDQMQKRTITPSNNTSNTTSDEPEYYQARTAKNAGKPKPKAQQGEYFQAKTAKNIAKKNEVQAKFNSSLAGQLKNSVGRKKREANDPEKQKQVKKTFNRSLAGELTKRTQAKQKKDRQNWDNFKEKTKTQQAHAKVRAKANEPLKKDQKWAKLSENMRNSNVYMTYVKTYNDIKNKKKTNAGAYSTDEVRKKQEQTLQNLGMKSNVNGKIDSVAPYIKEAKRKAHAHSFGLGKKKKKT